jgi:hypothetical protein
LDQPDFLGVRLFEALDFAALAVLVRLAAGFVAGLDAGFAAVFTVSVFAGTAAAGVGSVSAGAARGSAAAASAPATEISLDSVR